MYIRNVIIEGFMPFRDRHEINFEGGGIVGIKGVYGDNYDESNRAGKSAFIDAIMWAMYGKPRAKKAKDIELIFDRGDHALVSVEIFDPLTDEATWITRTRNKDNKGSLEITGREGEKKKATQEEIDQLVGMNANEFLFTAFFKQNDIDQFMKAEPQEKKQILMNWIQSNNWPVYEKQAGEFKSELSRDQGKIKTQIASFEEFSFDTKELKEEIAELTDKKTAMDKVAKVWSDELIQKEVQRKELANVENTKSSVKRLEQKITGLRASRGDSKEFAESLHKINTNLEAYPIMTKLQFEEAIDKEKQATSGTAELRAGIRELEGKLKSMDDTMTGFCPIINQACNRIEKDPEAESEMRKKINGFEKRIERFTELSTKCGKVQKLYQAQEGWRSKKAILEEKSKNAKGIEVQIADLLKDRVELIKTIPKDIDARREELSQRIFTLKDDLQSSDDEKAVMDQRLGEIGEALKNSKLKTDRLDALKVELEEIELQLSDAQYVEYMFGKNGIPSIELENSFQEIENDSNVILKALNAPFHIEFEAMRELKDWQPNCLACGLLYEKGTKTHVCKKCSTPREKRKRDELSLKIYEGGIERPSYLDSGGGQILQSVAIRLALTQLAKRRKGANWGTIFLDELFGQLDKSNRKLMADLITSTLIKELGFEQIFMISHDPDVQSATASNLIVRRNQKELYSELIMQ